MIIMTYVFLLPMMYSVQGNEISVHIDMNVNISKKQVTMDSDNCTSHTSPPGLWIASGVPGAPTCADFGAIQTNISGSGGQCYIFCKLQIEQKTRFFAWFWQALVDIFQQINPEPDPTTSAPTAIVPTTTTTTTTTKKTTKSTSEDVTWSPIRNACIKGNNYETYQPLTIDICKEKCVEEDAINCQSIEYSSVKKMCAISEERSDSEDFIEPCHVDGWVFAEIELNADRTTGAPITTAPTNNTTNGPNTGPPTTTAPSNTTTNVTSCNLVWNYEEDRPLIMIWGGQTVIPPIIDIDISEDPNRFPEGIYLIFACPGENNIFKHIEGNHTKLHGECISHDKLQVCVNEYSEIMDLSNLSCRSKMHPSIIKQVNDTSYKKSCEDIGGELYKIGYIYGDKKEFKDLDTKVCFSEKNQTTLWTSTNIDKIEISSSTRYEDPTKFMTARGFAMKTFYSQKSQHELSKEVLDKEATSVWNEKGCHNHGGHCVRGGKPCPEHLPHQTSQGEPFCSIFYRCCYSEQCDPTTCKYKGKKGKCSLDSLPGTTGVGSQECKKGCQCYINNNKTLRQFESLQERMGNDQRTRCDGEEEICPFQSLQSEGRSFKPMTRAGGPDCSLIWAPCWEEKLGMAPLVLAADGKRLLRSTPPGKLTFACPGAGNYLMDNTFNIKGEKSTELFECKNDGYFHNTNTNKKFTFRKFGCFKEISASVIPLNKMCGKDDIGKLYQIKFDPHLRLIDVCFHEDRQTTLWSNHDIDGRYLQWHEPNVNQGWLSGAIVPWKYPFYQIEDIYKKLIQEEISINVFGENYIKEKENKYLSRGHLSSKADFVTAPEQKATFFIVNTLPQWQVINQGNWLKIENAIRNFAIQTKSFLEIFTGGWDTLKFRNVKTDAPTKFLLGLYYVGGKDHIPVPAIFWKVVATSTKAVVFVSLNNPYILIPKTYSDSECHKLTWLKIPLPSLKDTKNGFIFCFTIDNFRKAFKNSHLPDQKAKELQLLD